MHRKMGEMMGERLALSVGLPRDRLLGKDNVADETPVSSRKFAGERQHVRGCIDAAPLPISAGELPNYR